ncbi:hypothetical protein HanRHA438_Chr14g0662721 [Helianthus annuus]|uniref:Protein GAMETE EXPRESSED 3 n=2 Tax=Helianthus annuus TaxID=4232 RepID=A0A9K3H6U4_HELAN|nr:hypothetical protein HanXRQr2_Chr14g0652051 [Helianthus annuus]KAJ0469390.1 hypothetical protein HanIR_Chr14g0707371 [Helianthus annuus]KAJ0660473.1 hypothetical protein HanOQP8_Chr14g0538181 [Helianthus annuus]KAJ0840988.1 hypothetical protein HanPSC8_Chr14g0625271 [Helianthus annuus]KAJ0854447.1 hypothetical protein HanRHA438_Chr14g0662721 [Helianthus annuus]
MGSLDGFLYSISPSGVVRKFFHRKNLDTVVQQAVLDCSGYAVYMSQTKFDRKISRANDENTYVSAMTPLKTVVTLLVPSTGSVIWFESYPSGQKLASSCSLMDIKKVSIYTGKLTTQVRFLHPVILIDTRTSFFTGNEKAIKLFLFYETILLILLAALVQFCCVFWRKKKLRNQNLRNFLEKRSSLRLQKKVCDRTITELEKKTAEGSSTNEMLEKLGDLVKEREVITRKLSTTYSLGRDATSPKSLSLIPLSDDKKTKSFSPKSGQKESATIFHTISDASSEDYSSIDEKTESKGKALMEPESASDGDDDGEHEAIVEAQGVKIDDEGDDLQTGGTSMRKRSISLTRNVGSST